MGERAKIKREKRNRKREQKKETGREGTEEREK